MAEKKWVIGLTGFLLVVLLLAGYMAMAAELGSRDDPLVTASYITEELMPSLSKRIDEAIELQKTKFTNDMNKQFDGLMAELEAAMGQYSVNDPAFIDAVAAAVIAKGGASGGTGGGTGGGTSDTMKKVEVASGKTVKLAIGSEVLLRLGTATCAAANAPGLIDITTGGDLSNGAELLKNHLYLCTIEGHGFKATANATVFIRGGYTIS